jgi:hypothetical protein
MRLLKLFAVFVMFFSVNISAATVSGNTYCDLDGDGNQGAGEYCTNEAVWIKLYNVAKDKLIATQPSLPSGEFSFHVNATGDFLLFIDNNGDFKDSTPTPPANTLFANPASGSIDITITTPDEVSAGHKLGLKPDPTCDCTGGDNNMTIVPIEIDGDMSDWDTVITDPDNGSCDSGCQTDYDINKTVNGVIQSTGRNLTHFAWTGEVNATGNVYGYTERVGSSTNTETFIFYKDGDADGLMESDKSLEFDFWVGVADLQILAKGWEEDYSGDPDLDGPDADSDPDTWIAADFGHQQDSDKNIPYDFWCGITDLQIMAAYWQGPNGGKPTPPADCLTSEPVDP